MHGNTKHGMTPRNGTRHPAYISWSSARQRCQNPKKEGYEYYGGRGICLDAEWADFPSFWRDMGATWFEGATLDRKDPDGNYTKDNCRWATKAEQMRNMRSNRIVDTPFGSMTMIEASERFGIPYDRLKKRLRMGWSPAKALGGKTVQAKEWKKPEVLEVFDVQWI